MKNEQPFSYTYSAKQREEAERIRKKFLPPEENPMDQLRRLDRSATQPGKIIALTVGILSTLVLGVGMCCTMVWTNYFIPGIAIGLLGIAGVASAFPLYRFVTQRQRKRLLPEIIKLSGALMGTE